MPSTAFSHGPTWSQLQAHGQRGGVDEAHVAQAQRAAGANQDERQGLVCGGGVGRGEVQSGGKCTPFHARACSAFERRQRD